MKFIHIADTHYRRNHNRRRCDLDPNGMLKTFLTQTDFSDIDFLLHAGDIVDDGDVKDYRSLKALFDEHLPDKVPVYFSLGNHDRKEVFYKAFGLEQDFCPDAPYIWSKMEKGLRIIVMDTTRYNEAYGYVTSNLLDWLCMECEKPSDGIIICQHHPLNYVLMDRVAKETNTRALELVSAALRPYPILGVFCGHLHQNLSGMIYGIPHYCCDSMFFGITSFKQGYYKTNRCGYNVVEIRDHVVRVEHLLLQPSEKILGEYRRSIEAQVEV